MSADSNTELIATYTDFILNARAEYAVAALVFYEHLITLKYEVDVVWKKRWSTATWIFVSNRYLMLANVVSFIVPFSPQTCGNTLAMNFLNFFAAQVIPIIPIHAFSTLRGVALLQGHPWRLPLTWVLVALAVASTALDTFENFTSLWGYVPDPLLGSLCFFAGSSVAPNVSQRLSAMLVLSAYTSSAVVGILSAAIVLVITLMKTVRQVRQASSIGLKATLSTVLLRDGSMFFLLVLFVDIFVTATNGVVLAGPVPDIMIPTIEILGQVLLSRFIINLRQVDAPTISASAGAHRSRMSSPNFRVPTMDEVVGNLGEPLDFVEYCVDDGDADGADAEHVDPEAERASTDGARRSSVADIEAGTSFTLGEDGE